jgi:hypothetical protein
VEVIRRQLSVVKNVVTADLSGLVNALRWFQGLGNFCRVDSLLRASFAEVVRHSSGVIVDPSHFSATIQKDIERIYGRERAGDTA